MLTSTLKGKIAKAVAGAAATSLVVGTLVIGGQAGADPKQFSAFVGVGSDTTQDVLNAFAGFNNNINYVPLQSNVASFKKQLASWDATGTPCITVKGGGPTFVRPNGSSNGRRALSRALDNAVWPTTTPDCGGPKVVSGQIDFARSSAGPSGTGTTLTYIPFGRDALSFGYYKSDGGAVTTLTSAELTALFTTGPQNIGGVDMVPCGIQTGSGTYQSWNTAVGATAAQEATATATCNAAGNGVRVQENDGVAFKAKGDAQPGKQVVIGYSAANFIAQSNGAAASQLGAGVDLGSIDVLGKPYTGTAPNLVPSSTFYNSTTYGRNVYNVLPTAKVGGLPAANQDVKSMFVGTSSAVCLATSTINAFGFATIGTCGSTTLQGPLVAN